MSPVSFGAVVAVVAVDGELSDDVLFPHAAPRTAIPTSRRTHGRRGLDDEILRFMSAQ
jgi:hypothetical protein